MLSEDNFTGRSAGPVRRHGARSSGQRGGKLCPLLRLRCLPEAGAAPSAKAERVGSHPAAQRVGWLSGRIFLFFDFVPDRAGKVQTSGPAGSPTVRGWPTQGVSAFSAIHLRFPTTRVHLKRCAHFRGTWKLTRDIYNKSGFLGFFKGFSATVAREMPGYFFFFGGYEGARHLLTPPGKTKDEIGPARTIVSGGVGGVCLWLSIFPADVVKSRIQITGSSEPALSVARAIIRSDGIRALYNGLGPTLLRTFPATGALFLAYEYTRKVMNSALGIE